MTGNTDGHFFYFWNFIPQIILKRGMSKRNVHYKEESDVEPTQRIPEEEMDEMEGEGDPGSDDAVAQDAPEQPDLGWYLAHWDMSPKAQIAICRTFANYLSAKLPKTVEAKPGRFSGKRIKK